MRSIVMRFKKWLVISLFISFILLLTLIFFKKERGYDNKYSKKVFIKSKVNLAPSERARLKGVEYTLSGFKNKRVIQIKAKRAVARDARIMPYIRTSLKQMVYMRNVLLTGFSHQGIDFEIEAKKASYDPQKKKIIFAELKKAHFFDKYLKTETLSIIIDPEQREVRIKTGPFSIIDASNQIIKKGRRLSGFIDEIFQN